MGTTLGVDSGVLIEIKVGGKSLEEITKGSLLIWSESELLDLLQRRLGKTRVEINQLLKSISNHQEGKSYA